MPDTGTASDNLYRLPWASETKPSGEAQPEPHNEQAEQALLGAILLKNDVLDQVSVTLRPEHFYFAFHGRLYAEMARLIVNRSGATPRTLKQWVEADQDGKTHGMDYLFAVQKARESFNIKPHAETIVDNWLRREAIKAAKNLIATASDPTVNIKDDFVALADQIDAVAAAPDDAQIHSFDDAVRGAMDQVRVAMSRNGIPTLPLLKFPALNDAILLEPHKLTILAGESGEGKSAISFQLAVEVADWVREQSAYGKRIEAGGVVLVSLEMSKEAVAHRSLSYFSGLDGKRIRRGLISDEEFQEGLLVAERQLLGLPMQIIDASALTVAQIRARCRQAQRHLARHFNTKIGLVIIDHLQEVREDEASAKGGGSWATGRVARDILAFAKSFGHTIALAQITRPTDKKGDFEWVPTAEHIAWSGAIRQVADQIVMLRRPEAHLEKIEPIKKVGEDDWHWQERVEAWRTMKDEWKNKALLIIEKARDGVAGASIRLTFRPETTSFSEVPGQLRE